MIIRSLVPSICMFRSEMESFHDFPFSVRSTCIRILSWWTQSCLSKSYSLWKLQITPVPVGQPQFLFLHISRLSLIPSFLSAFTSHLFLLLSLWPSCCLSFALLHFIFYLSAFYQSPCTSAPLSSMSPPFSLSTAYCQLCQPLNFFCPSVCASSNFSLTNTPI